MLITVLLVTLVNIVIMHPVSWFVLQVRPTKDEKQASLMCIKRNVSAVVIVLLACPYQVRFFMQGRYE